MTDAFDWAMSNGSLSTQMTGPANHIGNVFCV